MYSLINIGSTSVFLINIGSTSVSLINIGSTSVFPDKYREY